MASDRAPTEPPDPLARVPRSAPRSAADDPETVLIVDDEEPVRRTFREWLDEADLDVHLLAAADAEEALNLANERTVDLAILDWNLGAGSDGLQLLEDLYVFNPDIVAIMITGYAHQATPLDAMRMGVRDYLDKNQDLDRNTFLRAVRRQLDRIRPARRQKRLHTGLVAFREAVERVLPLVQTAAALNDPLSLPEVVASLFRFLLRSTGARDGVLLVRDYDPARQPAELCRAYDVQGETLSTPLVPFSRSLAGAAASMGQAHLLNHPGESPLAVELQAFERGRRSLLAAPLTTSPGLQVIVELFDKPGDGFAESDRQLVTAAADFGGEVLRHALAERQSHRALFEAIDLALRASDSLSATLPSAGSQPTPKQAGERLLKPPPLAVMEQLSESLGGPGPHTVAADDALRLAEAVRTLALKHGPAAVRHCTRAVESLRELLDELGGVEEAGP
ncbi:MAG: response regulator [Planctomycetes bacterium]|nr:response regulator [Planctomycetota bacterium]